MERTAKDFEKHAKKTVTKEEVLWDSRVRGLGLRVRPSGSPTWVLKIRVDGKQRKVGLGVFHPRDNPIAEARKAAQLKISEAHEGRLEDPAARRNAERVADLWFETEARWKTLRRSASYIANNTAWWSKYVEPVIGQMKVRDVIPADITRVLRPLASKPTTYNRVRSMLSFMFSTARKHGWVEVNPVDATDKLGEVPRAHYYSIDLFKRLLEVMEAQPMTSGMGVLRMVAYCGCRPNEAKTMKWSHLDLDRGIWTRPSQETKTKRTHVAELPARAVQMLRSWAEESGQLSEYVFPGPTGSPIQQYKTPWKRLKRELGIEEGTVYDLRRSLATHLLSNGVDLRTVMQVTGHTTPTILLRHYAHAIPGKGRAALEGLLE